MSSKIDSPKPSRKSILKSKAQSKIQRSYDDQVKQFIKEELDLKPLKKIHCMPTSGRTSEAPKN